MKKIKVLVVEDQSVVREGVVAILSLQKDMDVVGEAVDGIAAVELARKTKPDVILLDMVMPRQDGLTTIPLLKEFVPDAHIPVLMKAVGYIKQLNQAHWVTCSRIRPACNYCKPSGMLPRDRHPFIHQLP